MEQDVQDQELSGLQELSGREVRAREAAAEAIARADAGEGPDAGESRQAGRRIAQRVERADGDDVQVVADEHREAMDHLADGQATEDDVALATEWLLADQQQVNTRKLKVRIGGSDDEPTYAGWVISAIGVDVIRAAEREAAGNRQQRRSQEGYDELKANLRIVAEGTVQPDLKDAAKRQGLADPVVLLRRRFQYRSGVLAQIAGEIMGLSGFDADDVRAAGNS